MKAEVGDVQGMIDRLRDEYRITDRALLIKGGAVLAITVFLFIIHGFLHMEPSIAALLGATMLLVVVEGRHRRDARARDRVADADLLHGALHGGRRRRGDRPHPGHRRLGQQRLAGIAGRRHPDDPLGLRRRIGDHRQHPVHGHDAAHRRLPHDRRSPAPRAACSGGRWLSARAWAATRPWSARAPTSSPSAWPRRQAIPSRSSTTSRWRRYRRSSPSLSASFWLLLVEM